MDENAVEKIKTEIESNISEIRKFVTALNSDNQEGLYESLRNLHHFVDHFEQWVSSQMRTQFEDDVERKVKAIKDAGFSFNSITVDNVNFRINDEGNIEKWDPMDDNPF